MSEPGYDPVIVLDWLTEHCSQREDGRFVTIGRKLLDDSHRDTFDRWVLAMNTEPDFLVPLGRWDEILFTYGIGLWEFEDWSTMLYGWPAFVEIL